METNFEKAAGIYRGVEIDEADSDKVTDELVTEDTATINNNPRNSDE